mmetsp:Transcript_11363/g.52765  ORF Transcript_11363/g.52765 Transcript_11363/m.52765 type:complete len:231 (-) Transcript_11363:1084-1776(-)
MTATATATLRSTGPRVPTPILHSSARRRKGPTSSPRLQTTCGSNTAEPLNAFTCTKPPTGPRPSASPSTRTTCFGPSDAYAPSWTRIHPTTSSVGGGPSRWTSASPTPPRTIASSAATRGAGSRGVSRRGSGATWTRCSRPPRTCTSSTRSRLRIRTRSPGSTRAFAAASRITSTVRLTRSSQLSRRNSGRARPLDTVPAAAPISRSTRSGARCSSGRFAAVNLARRRSR